MMLEVTISPSKSRTL